MKKARNQPGLLERLGLTQRVQRAVQVGVGWYTAENWLRVKDAAADAEIFEATFEEWEIMAEETLKTMRNAGILPLKVEIDAEELLAWCQAHRKPNDGGARAQFVAQKLKQQA